MFVWIAKALCDSWLWDHDVVGFVAGLTYPAVGYTLYVLFWGVPNGWWWVLAGAYATMPAISAALTVAND